MTSQAIATLSARVGIGLHVAWSASRRLATTAATVSARRRLAGRRLPTGTGHSRAR